MIIHEDNCIMTAMVIQRHPRVRPVKIKCILTKVLKQYSFHNFDEFHICIISFHAQVPVEEDSGEAAQTAGS